MNLLRHVFIPAIALALAASSAVIAQTPPMPATASGAHRGHGAFNRALRSLDLTPAQQQQIAQLTQAYHQSHPKGSAHDPAAEKQLHAAIMNVLTPDQQAKFSAQLATIPSVANAPRPPMAGPMGGIALSDAQKAQIQALTQQYRAQILNVLTPEQKAQYQKHLAGMPAGAQMHDAAGFPGSRTGMMSGITLTADQKIKIQSLMAAFRQAHRGPRPDAAARQALHEQILQILTPEQQARFKANAAETMQRGGPFAPDPTPTPSA